MTSHQSPDNFTHDKSTNYEAKTVNLLMQPIFEILSADDVDEIAINEPSVIWAKTFGGWHRHLVPELTMEAIEGLITAIYSYNAMPERTIGSVIMPDGSRCQICRYPATVDGQISLMIRKHSTTYFTLDQLYDGGSFKDWKDCSFNQLDLPQIDAYNGRNDVKLSEVDKKLMFHKERKDILSFLRMAVKSHKNIVIAGKTGSGKTTFAKGLITEIPSDERIITIEDVHELHLPNHPNHVHMMFGREKGRVSAFEALMACMRQSPDRILLAELRGEETWEYLMSLNTGHPGGITTVHANGAVHTFERIAGLVKSSEVGKTVDLEAIRLILYSTIDIVLYFDKRQLKEVYFDPIYASQALNK